MPSLIEQVRADLKANSDLKTAETAHRFFKEEVRVYGIKAATVEKIAKTHWKQAKTLSKDELFSLCEALFQSGYLEEASVVSIWLPNCIDNLGAEDVHIFKRWIEKYVSNWAECDTFCNHTVGDLIQKYPEVVTEVKSWANSSNRWLKRASAVSFIMPAKLLFTKKSFDWRFLGLLRSRLKEKKGSQPV